MATLTISMPESMKAFIDSQLKTRGYGNVSEYVRSLLRDAQAREQDACLEELLLEGLASERIPLDDAFRQRLQAKVEQIIDGRRERS